MPAFIAGRHYKHSRTKNNNRRQHDQRKTTSIQSTERRRESISQSSPQIWKGNDSRTSEGREQDMQTIIELGQAARPVIIIAMTIGTILSLPVLLSLADDNKRD